MTMTRNELESKLTELTNELENVKQMDEQTVCRVYNVDEKSEIIVLIKEEISVCVEELKELNEYENRTINYQRTADMPYLCW